MVVSAAGLSSPRVFSANIRIFADFFAIVMRANRHSTACPWNLFARLHGIGFPAPSGCKRAGRETAVRRATTFYFRMKKRIFVELRSK